MKQKTIITATFTADLVAPSLEFWGRQLNLPSDVEVAPFYQVLQHLLDPSSLVSRNQDGVNVILMRHEDWLRYEENVNGTENGSKSVHLSEAKLRQVTEEFIQAVQTFMARATVPLIICICPSSPASEEAARPSGIFQQLEDRIASQLDSLSGVYLIRQGDLRSRYPVEEYYDAQADELGFIPFTPAMFAAIGTAVARTIHAIKSPPRKVIVLDCDETLWSGVVGEDGVEAIEIDPPHRQLQEFMVRQHDAGMIICLCSKNNEADVLEVFDRRDDMPLKREHLTSWRINWESKSQNIRSLASELELGLDSFIFVDDNALECAEVRAGCGEVLACRLPQEPRRIPEFLQHVWAFDHLNVTGEDKRRTALYQQNLERSRFESDTSSLQEFIAGLQLDIRVSELQEGDAPRVAQLTQRTNQFNATGRRRSESEIRKACLNGTLDGRVVEVSDRFGDYGLVGVVLFETQADSLAIDSFLLSCRAMGKGVEHRMFAHVGELARDRGVASICCECVFTDKNVPVQNFLAGIAGDRKQESDSGFRFRMAADEAAEVAFEPGGATAATISKRGEAVEAASRRNGDGNGQTTGGNGHHGNGHGNHPGQTRNELLERIANELNRSDAILKAISATLRRDRPNLAEAYEPAQNEVEEMLVDIWAELLGLDRVGVHDRFVTLGGDSLIATQVVSRINTAFDTQLEISDVFAHPTVQTLAMAIEEHIIEELAGLGEEEAELLAAEEENPDEVS